MKFIKRTLTCAIGIVGLTNILCAMEQKEVLYYKAEYETEVLKRLFADVTFSQPDVKVRKGECVNTKGNLEVHFNDISQIQETLDKPVHLSAKGKIWYIKDLENDKSIQYTSDQHVCYSPCFYIDAKKDIKIRGSLKTDYYLITPKRTDINELNLMVKNSGQGTLGQKSERKQLIKILGSFDEQLFRQRTSDALSLTKISKDRDACEEEKKTFLSETCPDLFITYNKNITEIVTDVIDAKKTFAMISKTKEELNILKSNLTLGRNYFRLILPEVSMSGIYSLPPLYLLETHKILCDGELFMTGRIKLPKSNLEIKAKGNIWFMELKLYTGASLNLKSGAILRIYGLYPHLLKKLSEEMPCGMFIPYVQYLAEAEMISQQFAIELVQAAILRDQLDLNSAT